MNNLSILMAKSNLSKDRPPFISIQIYVTTDLISLYA